MLEGCLSFGFIEEIFYVFNVLRKDHEEDLDKGNEEDPAGGTDEDSDIEEE